MAPHTEDTSSVATIVGKLVDILTGKKMPPAEITTFKEQMSSLFDSAFGRLDKHDEVLMKQTKIIDDQQKVIEEMAHRISALEKGLKRQVVSSKKRDIAQVRNHIIVKSNKSEKDIRAIVVKSLELGGANKIPPSHISLVELTSPSTSDQRAIKVFRMLLLDGQKAALFKGLPKCQMLAGDSQTKFDNEIPLYAQQAKKELEQLSYSLRSKFKTDKLRAKIYLGNLKLKMKVKVGDGEWFTPEDARASRFFDSTPVIYKEADQPTVVPMCKDFYKRVLQEQE